MQPQTSKTQQNIPEDQPKQIKLQAKFLNKLNIPLDVLFINLFQGLIK